MRSWMRYNSPWLKIWCCHVDLSMHYNSLYNSIHRFISGILITITINAGRATQLEKKLLIGIRKFVAYTVKACHSVTLQSNFQTTLPTLRQASTYICSLSFISLSLSFLAICFCGLEYAWNLGSASFQKPWMKQSAHARLLWSVTPQELGWTWALKAMQDHTKTSVFITLFLKPKFLVSLLSVLLLGLVVYTILIAEGVRVVCYAKQEWWLWSWQTLLGTGS